MRKGGNKEERPQGGSLRLSGLEQGWKETLWWPYVNEKNPRSGDYSLPRVFLFVARENFSPLTPDFTLCKKPQQNNRLRKVSSMSLV
jgi:hypothetical protein